MNSRLHVAVAQSTAETSILFCCEKRLELSLRSKALSDLPKKPAPLRHCSLAQELTIDQECWGLPRALAQGLEKMCEPGLHLKLHRQPLELGLE